MQAHRTLVALAVASLALSGCIAKTLVETAVDVATIPVKVVSAGVDAATTSQSEADEKRGRAARKADEQRGREAREAAKKAGEAAPATDPE